MVGPFGGGLEVDKSHLVVHPEHILTRDLREKALVRKSLQIEANLSIRTKELPPLKIGDVVSIQQTKQGAPDFKA